MEGGRRRAPTCSPCSAPGGGEGRGEVGVFALSSSSAPATFQARATGASFVSCSARSSGPMRARSSAALTGSRLATGPRARGIPLIPLRDPTVARLAADYPGKSHLSHLIPANPASRKRGGSVLPLPRAERAGERGEARRREAGWNAGGDDGGFSLTSLVRGGGPDRRGHWGGVQAAACVSCLPRFPAAQVSAPRG